jgi:hypothetical protein
MLKLIEAKTGLVTKDADLTMKAAEVKESAVELGQKAMGDTVDALGTAQALDQITATFISLVSESLGAIQETTAASDQKIDELAVKVDRVPSGGTITRKGGKITANVEFDDGSSKSLSGVREGGELRIVGANEGPESSD